MWFNVICRKLRSRLSSGVDKPGTHQFCVDAWIIYNNHLSDLDGPRTGGGLRSNRRGFDSEDYYFSARRSARQYNAYGEDMMLVLFLVCILATLVTVHRAACYRQIQDARRNTPLRHIIPIPEDNPPPYTHRYPDSGKFSLKNILKRIFISIEWTLDFEFGNLWKAVFL